MWGVVGVYAVVAGCGDEEVIRCCGVGDRVTHCCRETAAAPAVVGDTGTVIDRVVECCDGVGG